MKKKIILEIPGEAVAKQRPRVALRGNYPRVYTPKETINYETLVKTIFVNEYPDFVPLETPLTMKLLVHRTIPKSFSEKKKTLAEENFLLPTTKPDLDNVIKIICDSLNKIAFRDDSNIVEINAKKIYSNIPKVIIEIEEM